MPGQLTLIQQERHTYTRCNRQERHRDDIAEEIITECHGQLHEVRQENHMRQIDKE